MSLQLSLTLIGRNISHEALSTILKACQGMGLTLDQGKCLSDGQKLDSQAYLYALEGPSSIEQLNTNLADLSADLKIDAVFQYVREQQIKLACFDMDSTLIKAEVIDLLATHAGVGNQVASITERAMQGELDFNQSFTERMRLLKGLDAEVINEVAQTLPIMEGGERLFKNLDQHNIDSAILSGGFDYFARHLQQRFNIDSTLANTLEVNAGKLTGHAIAPIINAEQKRIELLRLAQEKNIDAAMTMAVGDGANDLAMLASAGLGVAYKAKPIVQSQAAAALNHNGLDALLFLLGYDDSQIIP